MTQRLATGLAMLLTAAACGDRGRSPDAVAASRAACQHEALLDEAQRELATLEGATTTAPMAALAARTFALAYARHAEVQFRRSAHLDSAANARSAAEGERFRRLADQFAIRAPSPGTVEASAVRSYATDAARLRADSAHACYRIFR